MAKVSHLVLPVAAVDQSAFFSAKAAALQSPMLDFLLRHGVCQARA